MRPIALDRQIPDAVLARIHELVGRPVLTTPLGGMSGADVHRVAGPGGTVVAKGGVSARELAVYRELRPLLDGHGVRIPVSHGAVVDAGGHWLVLEDVPTPLPRARWLADPEVMATLGRLHRLRRSSLDALPDRFRPAWTEAMDRAALAWLPGETDLLARLAALRAEAAPLFAPLGPISGDPNPLNWGIAVTGELVLMDWGRIGHGHPALDIAITIPGLPSAKDFEVTAQAYRRSIGHSTERKRTGVYTRQASTPLAPDARQLALAKVWTVVEFLAEAAPTANPGMTATGRRQREMAAGLARAVPNWLRSVAGQT